MGSGSATHFPGWDCWAPVLVVPAPMGYTGKLGCWGAGWVTIVKFGLVMVAGAGGVTVANTEQRMVSSAG